MSRIRLLLCLGLLGLAVMLFAAVPPIINYQGKLVGADNKPVADGSYKLTFFIYDAPTGGTMKWTMPDVNVYVKGGVYSVLLGGNGYDFPTDLFDSPDRFFAVKVGNGAELTPRQQIASVPFAIRAAVADKATTADKAITADTVADGAITANKIGPNAITLAYTKITVDFDITTADNKYVQVPGLTTTATMPGNGRMVKVTVWTTCIENVKGGYVCISLWDGPVGTGTLLAETSGMGTAFQQFPASLMTVLIAPTGAHTFNVGLRCIGGEAYLATPAFILVEAL